MTTLYITEPHTVVKKDSERLILKYPKNEDGTAPKSRSIPMMKVDQVVIQADSTLTTPAMLALLEQKADICFLNYFGQFRGRLTNGFTKNAGLRLAQHRKSVMNNPRQALAPAKLFVKGKLSNMRTMLLRANRTLQDEQINQATQQIAKAIKQAEQLLPAQCPPLDPSNPLANSMWGQLLGFEGSGSAAYFRVFGKLLKHGWLFDKRVRRPPTDPVNALLSYGYTLLTNQIATAVQIVGFDPYIGFLHSSQYGKPALALDLVEEFRPVVIDSLVLRLLNQQILKPTDFEETFGAYQLTKTGRKRFLEQYEARLNETITHPLFGYKRSYRAMIEVQTRLLAKWVQDEIEAYVPFTVR